MPIRTIIDNTYYIFDSLGTALSWNAGSRIRQIRIFALNTSAVLEFQIAAGTPWLSWNLITHGAVSVGSASALIAAHHVLEMGNHAVPVGIIPTTLTACTAWIDFA